VEEGDRASWQVRVTATHTGTMQTPNGPLPATGKRIRIDALDVARFENGQAGGLARLLRPAGLPAAAGAGAGLSNA
jgi:hypothetical protein